MAEELGDDKRAKPIELGYESATDRPIFNGRVFLGVVGLSVLAAAAAGLLVQLFLHSQGMFEDGMDVCSGFVLALAIVGVGIAVGWHAAKRPGSN